jgi:hypothetical protein
VPAPLGHWEALWAPYDETTYRAVLEAVVPEDTVLEIGAGDLRLARRLAGVARQVIAWELQPGLLNQARAAGPLPSNLEARVADARSEPMPPGITCATLLMRHCSYYQLYIARLREAGCRRLITNARWRTGIEVIDLAPAILFESVPAGWYTCRRCGAVGFAADSPAQIDDSVVDRVTDVEGCPHCGYRQQEA